MLGNTEYKLNELEKQSADLKDKYEVLLTQIGIFKKKVNSLTSDNESLQLRIETVENILQENHL